MNRHIRIAGTVVLVLGLLASVFGGQGAAAERDAATGQRDYRRGPGVAGGCGSRPGGG